MGWVTLSLRKRELYQEHQYYQLRDLQISREKRKLARTKAYEMAVIQANEKADTNAQRKNSEASGILEQISKLRKQLSEAKTTNDEAKKNAEKGTTPEENYDFTVGDITVSASDYNSASKQVTDGINELTTKYTEANNTQTAAINAIKDMYDQQKSDLEEEVAEQETALDEEQADVEAQMEAVAQELQAVSEAISQEIQNSTIKLS